MTSKRKMSAEGAELLKAVKQMKTRKKGRVYTPEQLLAISARKSVKMTQKEFARLLHVSVDSIQDWEQGRRTPTGAARTLLQVAQRHPEVLQELRKKNITALFVDVQDQPRYMMERIDIIPDMVPEEHIFRTFKECTAWVRKNVKDRY